MAFELPSPETKPLEAETEAETNPLEAETEPLEVIETSYAKEQPGETNLLGVPWNKKKDTIKVNFPESLKEITKRSVLGNIAKIYNPVGIVSPTTFQGKFIYREICHARTPWDKKLTPGLLAKWISWEKSPPKEVETMRSLVRYAGDIEAIDLHAFGDDSGKGVSSVVYAVTDQQSGIKQGIVVSRSRLAKKGLTVLKLELVAGLMSTNLLHNVKESLVGFPVRNAFSWLDSTVALYWIRGNGEYKQFFNHRGQKIQEKD